MTSSWHVNYLVPVCNIQHSTTNFAVIMHKSLVLGIKRLYKDTNVIQLTLSWILCTNAFDPKLNIISMPTVKSFFNKWYRMHCIERIIKRSGVNYGTFSFIHKITLKPNRVPNQWCTVIQGQRKWKLESSTRCPILLSFKFVRIDLSSIIIWGPLSNMD